MTQHSIETLLPMVILQVDNKARGLFHGRNRAINKCTLHIPKVAAAANDDSSIDKACGNQKRAGNFPNLESYNACQYSLRQLQLHHDMSCHEQKESLRRNMCPVHRYKNRWFNNLGAHICLNKTHVNKLIHNSWP